MSQPVASRLAAFECIQSEQIFAHDVASSNPALPPRRYADDPALAAMRAAATQSAPQRASPKRTVAWRVNDAFDPLIAASARKFGHDPLLLRAMIQVESAFKDSAVSHKGAIGLMQIMPDTGRRFGVDNPQRELFSPALNIEVGARYLRVLRDLFGERLELAVAAYNAGEGAVMRHDYRIPPYTETQAYVRRVLSTYGSYRAGALE